VWRMTIFCKDRLDTNLLLYQHWRFPVHKHHTSIHHCASFHLLYEQGRYRSLLWILFPRRCESVVGWQGQQLLWDVVIGQQGSWTCDNVQLLALTLVSTYSVRVCSTTAVGVRRKLLRTVRRNSLLLLEFYLSMQQANFAYYVRLREFFSELL
jgi:hypothetical protein